MSFNRGNPSRLFTKNLELPRGFKEEFEKRQRIIEALTRSEKTDEKPEGLIELISWPRANR